MKCLATDLLDWLFFNFYNLLFLCTMKHFFITHYKKYAKKFISVLKSLKHVWWMGNNILLHSLSHSWNSAAAHIWSIKKSVIIYQKNTKYFIKSLNTFAKFIRGRVPNSKNLIIQKKQHLSSWYAKNRPLYFQNTK